MDEARVQVVGLTKHFGAIQAVGGISFAVRAGEIYGLLGPNGAGKTTTISCLCGLVAPDGGRVLIDGVDLAVEPIRARRSLAVVPQETAIYDTLSARENVSYFAALHGLSGSERTRRVEEALRRVGLDPASKQQARKFSGGMKRRLNLAIGLVSGPRLLLLDEPTVGIDPQARIHILEVVREVQRAGTAILYTTHYLEEAETLCDRVGIMDHGRILAEGTIPELRALVGEGTVVTLKGGFDREGLERAVPAGGRVRILSAEDGAAMVSVTGERRAAFELVSSLLREGVAIGDIAMQEASLQSVFIRLTGRELRD